MASKLNQKQLEDWIVEADRIMRRDWGIDTSHTTYDQAKLADFASWQSPEAFADWFADKRGLAPLNPDYRY